MTKRRPQIQTVSPAAASSILGRQPGSKAALAFSFRARESFDGQKESTGASRGGQASLNRPTKKSERQLVCRADARRRLRTETSRSKPSGRHAWTERREPVPAFGFDGMVEGDSVRFVRFRSPQIPEHARSAYAQFLVGPGGSTRLVHFPSLLPTAARVLSLPGGGGGSDCELGDHDGK